MQIRAAVETDRDAIWRLLEPVIREQALAHWFELDHVAEEEEEIVDTYYLRTNRLGGGDHVANCGYVTAPWATGRGVARAMAVDSLERARACGFAAMQFNFVVSTNERAVRLWESLGFDIAGRLPGAVRHPERGFVDAFIMYRSL